MQYKYIYMGLGLVGLAALIFGVVLAPEGDTVDLPDPIQAISPAPGSQVPVQTPIEIDLEVGYIAEIWVDGWAIGDAQFVEATGVYRWVPGPTSPSISEWTPGEHTVRIVYNTYTGLPDTGTFEWSFRVIS